MNGINVVRLDGSEFVDNRLPLGDRIAAAELDIEQVLRRYGVKFAINVVKLDGKALHQEIVLVDRRD